MPNELLIYLIVAMNALVQVILIWRLRFPPGRAKWMHCLSAVAAPLVILAAMRLLVAGGIIDARLAQQTLLERWLTLGASALLLVSPWLVTLAAIMNKKRRAALQE